LQGIGDTLRVSLSADPVEEVRVGFDILKSLGLRHRGVNLVACPSCARQEFDVIATVAALEERLADITEPLHVSVIGCVVNGPGEALVTQVGVTGAKRSQLYINGKLTKRLDNDHLVDEIEKEVRQYLKEMA
jgi:(E)-4-hydroxy-3-methylbut-2-enyl-diphosphate synthase